MEKGVIQPGCEVVALYDFDQQNKEDLPFAAGEILTILKPTTDPHWVIAKRNRDDVQGVIPVPYVSLIQPQPPVGPLNPRFVVAPDASRADRQVPHPKESKQQEERLIAAKWYHGAISREDSERLILEARCDGAFLVRDSSTHSGDYTLVVLKLGSPIIDHYRIQAIPEVKLPPEHKKAAQSRRRSTLYAVYYTIDEESYFETINDLVEHYAADADGICTNLQRAIPRRSDAAILRFAARSAAPTSSAADFRSAQMGSSSWTAQPSSHPRMATNSGIAHVNITRTEDASSSNESRRPPLSSAAAAHVKQQMMQFAAGGWLVSAIELNLHALIGKGEFGEVYQGVLRTLPRRCEPFRDELLAAGNGNNSVPNGSKKTVANGGFKVAIKLLKDAQFIQAFVNEALIMTELQHRNLVRLLAIVLNEPSGKASGPLSSNGPSLSFLDANVNVAELEMRIVTEFCAGHNLLDYLRSRGRAEIGKTEQLRFAIEVSDALAYLESKRIVHRDVAARNILLDHRLVCKLSDFGLARKLDATMPLVGPGPEDTGKLPVKWTAPEAIRDASKFTSKSDVWSFGVLLHEIYSFGTMPYRRIKVADVLSNVENGYRMEAPADCPPTLYQWMLACWHKVPEQRPAFHELYSRLVALRDNPAASATSR